MLACSALVVLIHSTWLHPVSADFVYVSNRGRTDGYRYAWQFCPANSVQTRVACGDAAWQGTGAVPQGPYSGSAALGNSAFCMINCVCSNLVVKCQCTVGLAAEGGECVLRNVLIFVNSMAKPQLTLNTDGSGGVSLLLTVSPLPAPSVVHGTNNLAYAADVAADASGLSSTVASCPHLRVGESAGTFVKYSQLTSCNLTVAFVGEQAVVSGVVGVFLLQWQDGGTNESIREWVFPFSVTFVREARAVSALDSWTVTTMAGQQISAGAFHSHLELFETNLFTSKKSAAVYRDGEHAFVKHSLDKELLDLSHPRAWLSVSADGTQPVHANLTANLSMLGSGPGWLRFSVPLGVCENCYLHVVCTINLDGSGRRLATFHDAYQFLPINIREMLPGSDGEVRVNLIIPAALAILLALAASACAGALFRVFQIYLAKHGTSNKCRVLLIEFVDVLAGIMSLVLCKSSGVLDFGNDGGAISAVLQLSTIAGAVFFFVEIGLICCVEAEQFDSWLPRMQSWHFMCEDCFQLFIYAIVAATQAQVELGHTEVFFVVAIAQAALFVLLKFMDALPLDPVKYGAVAPADAP